MLAVMRDPRVPAKRRDEMAKAAAPYLHSRLSAIAHSGPEDDDTNGSPIDQHFRIEFINSPRRPDDA
jgi:hypothetical protein